jgi:hypothetical protein
MAEQSIGMATGTGAAFGDGNVGAGYPSSRMIDMERRTLGEGVLQLSGAVFAMTGTGTGTLAIGNGSAVVTGYYYDNTSTASIVISTLANATYSVAILVNNTAGNKTVSRCVSGTTVGTYSVRLVVATSAQLAGQDYVYLGTITVSAAVITAIAPAYNNMYATSMQLPYQCNARMTGGAATLTLANTFYTVAAYSGSAVSQDNIFSVDTTTGEITVRRTGLYTVMATGNFGTGTTGNRILGIAINGTYSDLTRAASSGTAEHQMTQTSIINITAITDVVTARVISSIAAQTFTGVTLTIVRA